MFCPGCGANNSTEQKFCRTCGLNLEQIAESFLSQFPNAERAEMSRRQQRLERFGTFAFGGFITVVGVAVIGLIFTVITRFIISGSDVWKGVIFTALIVFAALLLAYVVMNESLKDKHKKKEVANSSSDSVRGAATTGRLLEEGEIIPIPSIVEETTDLLQVEQRTRKP